MSINKRHPGFTFAEVLIAIVVIGVVAAMTVPTLINSYNDRMYRSALKKNFSVLSNAFNMAKKYEYNEYEDWSHNDSDQQAIYQNYQYLKKYLFVLRECNNTSGCWSKDLTKAPGGEIADGANANGIGGNIISFTLNDGTNVSMDYYSKSDTIQMFGVNKNMFENPLTIWVDVNGDKKPNMMGKDVFSFVLTKNGLLPSGNNNDSANCNTTGYDCCAKYIHKT